MAEPNLYEFLRNVPAVAALVGDRIYPVMVPQGHPDGPARLPCVVYTRVTAARQVLFCGTDRAVQASYQLDAYAAEYDSAVAVATAIRAALVDYGGQLGDVAALRCSLEADFDTVPDPEPGIFRRLQTFTIWYREA